MRLFDQNNELDHAGSLGGAAGIEDCEDCDALSCGDHISFLLSTWISCNSTTIKGLRFLLCPDKLDASRRAAISRRDI
jgi:hypothetical protein